MTPAYVDELDPILDEAMELVARCASDVAALEEALRGAEARRALAGEAWRGLVSQREAVEIRMLEAMRTDLTNGRLADLQACWNRLDREATTAEIELEAMGTQRSAAFERLSAGRATLEHAEESLRALVSRRARLEAEHHRAVARAQQERTDDATIELHNGRRRGRHGANLESCR